MKIAQMVSVAALVGIAACSSSPVAPNGTPDFKVARGNANSGTYTCTQQGSPTYKHVTADRKEALIQQGYTCTKD
jgi:putative hemolysin